MILRISNSRRGQVSSHRRSLSVLHRVVGLARVGKRGFASGTSAYNRNRYRSLAALGQAVITRGTPGHHFLIQGVAANGHPTITPNLVPASNGAEEEEITAEETYFPNIEKYLDTGVGPKPVVSCAICFRTLIIQGLQEPANYHTTWTQDDDGEYEEPYILGCGHILGKECLAQWCRGILKTQYFPPGPLCPVCRDPILAIPKTWRLRNWPGSFQEGSGLGECRGPNGR